MMHDSAICAHVAAELTRNGYVVVDDFLEESTIAALAAECSDLHARRALRPAAIGRAGGRHLDAAVRGDQTQWFNPAALSAAQRRYWSRMDRLRQALNRELLLGLEELEAHFALYPPGAGYARHRDRFRDDDARVLSTVLYLNPDWHAHHGGALRLFLNAGGLSRPSAASGALGLLPVALGLLPGGLSRPSMASEALGLLPGAPTAYCDIYPAAGRLVAFLSADFEHEVLPASRDRMSIAGWQRRASIAIQSRLT